MADTKIALDVIQIASPCSASWDAMSGDQVRRFCGECQLHVHNLSEMSRREAEALVSGVVASTSISSGGGSGGISGGRVCVQMQRGADGRIVTRDDRQWRAKLRRRAAYVGVRTLMGLSAAAVVLLGGTTALASRDINWFNKLAELQERLAKFSPVVQPTPAVAGGIRAVPVQPVQPGLMLGEAQVILGDVALPAPEPAPAPAPAPAPNPPIRGKIAVPTDGHETSAPSAI